MAAGVGRFLCRIPASPAGVSGDAGSAAILCGLYICDRSGDIPHLVLSRHPADALYHDPQLVRAYGHNAAAVSLGKVAGRLCDGSFSDVLHAAFCGAPFLESDP